MEINKEIEFNPIMQDRFKNGSARNYSYGDIMFNYGALPQTWEDNKIKHPVTSAIGDNDPIDIIEIGIQCLEIGSITPIKILGVLALIDGDETDWKVIGISKYDVLYDNMDDIEDVILKSHRQSYIYFASDVILIFIDFFYILYRMTSSTN